MLYLCIMLTRYTIKIGSGTEQVIPDECLKNWDEISWTIKRTDYSGVMRSFSTEFVFCGVIADAIFEEYLSNGFNSSAVVAVYTITNNHTWEKQFEAPLDFSTLEKEDGYININALDSSLAALIKSKKGQKYEIPVSELKTSDVKIERIEIANSAKHIFVYSDTLQTGVVNLTFNESQSSIISKEYAEFYNQNSGNTLYAKIIKTGVSNMRVNVQGVVRCPFTQGYDIVGEPLYPTKIAQMKVRSITEDPSTGGNIYKDLAIITDNDLLHKVVNGATQTTIVGGSKRSVYPTLAAMTAAAGYLFPGKFGVVGVSSDVNSQEYYENNTIYEYDGTRWVNKGKAKGYYQDRSINKNSALPEPELHAETYLRLEITGGSMRFMYGIMNSEWSDPTRTTFTCRGIHPESLIENIVHKFSPNASVSIVYDEGSLLSKTYIMCGEELRRIPNAKVYTTFDNFCSWIEAVFGYTYRINSDNEIQFVHRSEVFIDNVEKVIGEVRDVKYSVQSNLLYTEVDAGYAKKDYGEIDGRYEHNFTDYFSTGITVTDKKMTLQSKYRADGYGVEFTARKSESETTDDKADEDVFFVYAYEADGVLTYRLSNQEVYRPSVCVVNNGRYIAALGNGEPVTLTMTASDGHNMLASIVVDNALFSAGEVELHTDDITLPADPNGMVQFDHGGYRYTGFIGEAECRYGRVSGIDYTIIVKDITEL